MGVLSQATIVLSLLRTGFAMGVFLQATSQVAIFIQAKFTMEVFCFITEIHYFLCQFCASGRFCFRMLALQTMGMLIHAAGQFPCTIASLAVMMSRSFFKRTDQTAAFVITIPAMKMCTLSLRNRTSEGFSICRHFFCGKADITMLMLQDPNLSANKYLFRSARAGFYCSPAGISVTVQNNFFFVADQDFDLLIAIF